MRRRRTRPHTWIAAAMAGFSINLLVAWSFAIWCPCPVFDSHVPEAPESMPRSAAGFEWAWCAIVPHQLNLWRLQTGGTRGLRVVEAVGVGRKIIRIESSWRFGWPLAALEFRRRSQDRPREEVLSGALSADRLGPFLARLRAPPARRPWAGLMLPIHPLPLGLAAGTSLYSGLTLVMAAGLHHLRKRSRRRRNLCPACSYSRAGLGPAAPCPECGATAEERSSRSA